MELLGVFGLKNRKLGVGKVPKAIQWTSSSLKRDGNFLCKFHRAHLGLEGD